MTADLPGIEVTPAEATLKPGDSVALTISMTADPAAIPGIAMMGELLLQSDNPAVPPVVVPIRVVPVGGVITTDLGTVDFGQVGTATAHTLAVTLSNTGNKSFSVMAGPFANPAFTISGSSMFALAPA